MGEEGKRQCLPGPTEAAGGRAGAAGPVHAHLCPGGARAQVRACTPPQLPGLGAQHTTAPQHPDCPFVGQPPFPGKSTPTHLSACCCRSDGTRLQPPPSAGWNRAMGHGPAPAPAAAASPGPRSRPSWAHSVCSSCAPPPVPPWAPPPAGSSTSRPARPQPGAYGSAARRPPTCGSASSTVTLAPLRCACQRACVRCGCMRSVWGWGCVARKAGEGRSLRRASCGNAAGPPPQGGRAGGGRAAHAL